MTIAALTRALEVYARQHDELEAQIASMRQLHARCKSDMLLAITEAAADVPQDSRIAIYADWYWSSDAPTQAPLECLGYRSINQIIDAIPMASTGYHCRACGAEFFAKSREDLRQHQRRWMKGGPCMDCVYTARDS